MVELHLQIHCRAGGAETETDTGGAEGDGVVTGELLIKRLLRFGKTIKVNAVLFFFNTGSTGCDGMDHIKVQFHKIISFVHRFLQGHLRWSHGNGDSS